MAKIIVGNWKMYLTISEARELVAGLKKLLAANLPCTIAVCPAFTALAAVASELKDTKIACGAQNMHYEEQGAFTGEISPKMLADIGCRYVILGHSERRHYFAETDELINKKMHAALKYGLIPIVCVGEQLAQRTAGTHFEIVFEQIQKSLANLSSNKIIIAYEPVWAIGTGKNATPPQADEMHAFIKKNIQKLYSRDIPVLYGGSVKPQNAKELLLMPHIDGALVGGASLNAESFLGIIQAS